MRIEESDMYLHPDLDTFMIFPWRPQQGKVARIICDVYMADGTPFEGDPRYILKKQIEKAKQMGYIFNVGPSVSFSFSTWTRTDSLQPSRMREQGTLTWDQMIWEKTQEETWF